MLCLTLLHLAELRPELFLMLCGAGGNYWKDWWGSYMSSLTTANINLFDLEPPLMLLIALKTLQCAWLPKLGKSTEKKATKCSSIQENTSISEHPQPANWCGIGEWGGVIYAFTFLIVFCMSLFLGLRNTNTLVLRSNFYQLAGQSQNNQKLLSSLIYEAKLSLVSFPCHNGVFRTSSVVTTVLQTRSRSIK